jgi:glycosyltransferase involved in cell wall biosynthesis
MRILLINNFHNLKGGADRVYLNTGIMLTQKGHDVLYFSSLSSENEETEYSRYFVNISNKREANFLTRLSGVRDYIYNRKAYDNLSKLIDECKPEVAHVHLFCGGLSSSILKILNIKKIPIIQTLHDYRLLCPANAFLDGQNEICEKCINKSFYQCSVKKCVDGNFFFSTIVTLEAYYRKYFIDPLDYINHFIFVSNFSRNKHIEFDKRYASRSSKLFNFTLLGSADSEVNVKKSYFLYFGRLSIEKGIHSLVKSAVNTGITLKIVGNGPILKELELIANENPNIQLMGHQSGTDLEKVIKECYFIVVPSECYENNPMTVLEAYSMGKPVIGTRIGGIPEIVIDGETGFLCEQRNVDDLSGTLLKALNLDENAYQNMARNARKFAEDNFSTEVHYKELMSIYSKVMNHA